MSDNGTFTGTDPYGPTVTRATWKIKDYTPTAVPVAISDKEIRDMLSFERMRNLFFCPQNIFPKLKLQHNHIKPYIRNALKYAKQKFD